MRNYKPFCGFLSVLLVLSAVGGLSGCGYTNKTLLPHGIKTIYVQTTKNDIPIDQMYAYQPGLEMSITNAVIRRLERDGNLKVVPEGEADAILKTVLIGYEQEGLRFTKLETVQEFRLFVVIAAQLLDAQTGAEIWSESSFSGDAEYFVSSVRSVARAKATQLAIDRLAKNLVDRIVEDW